MVFRNNIFLFAFWLFSMPFASAVYDEMYRPQLHYSPPKGWLSDPDGLVYGDGLYHLFYQCQPNQTEIENLHWGHAISSDLVHWKTLETALIPPTADNAFFSGGAIFDRNNITGLQTNANMPTLLLMPTFVNLKTSKQDIWLAYSNDGPEYAKFKYYLNNPIIPGPPENEIPTCRDSTVFKYQDYYVLILVSYNRTKFYQSRNLLEWDKVSEFGEFEGAHTGRWESPSLIPFKVTIDGKQVEKYVLIITLTDFVHPVHQYFIGSFDGKKFTNDNSKDTVRWLDHGLDSFAGITYNQLPDGRHIFLYWMNRWEYCDYIDFTEWNGQIGLPRKLKLIQIGNELRVTSLPISEIETLRMKRVRNQNIIINIANEFNYKIPNPLVDIEMMFDLKEFKPSDSFDIVFSGKKDSLKISFKANEFILDRTLAGNPKKGIPHFDDATFIDGNFDDPYADTLTIPKSFGLLWKAPRLINSSNLKMRIIIDTNAIEMFADDGLTSMSALFFSKDGIASKMTIKFNSATKTSLIRLKEINVYGMKSIWHRNESILKNIQSSARNDKRKHSN